MPAGYLPIGIDPVWRDVDEDLIMIDIETQHMGLVACEPKRSGVLAMERIRQHLRAGSTLGPLSVLLILVVYSLLSPLLPPVVHDYIYHILH